MIKGQCTDRPVCANKERNPSLGSFSFSIIMFTQLDYKFQDNLTKVVNIQMVNYLNASIGYDTTFELNEFNEPRIRSEIEVIKNVILFILFAKPGQYPSLPHIGLDIQSMLYSFYDEIDEADLKFRINEQCNAMGVYMNEGVIQLKKTKYKGHPSLMISIEGSEHYPDGYMRDHINNSNRYLIGITFDELNRMIYNINSEGGV